ncbi:MAG TPA: hypothetical protein VK759_04410 [Rhizomicrobium sp.]|nr:hypothetical protein [Rhizomicrobium sp.]
MTMPRERAPAQARANADPALKLAAIEWAFLAGTILCWTALVISLGQDTSWDFRNYHWYIPYAFLNHRMGFDVAVAHQATYYNPLLDVPYYLLATHVRPWLAVAIMGAVQGSNVVPLYLLARQSLRVPERMLSAAFVALMGMTGALALGLLGTTYYDNVMSVFVLSSLAILVINRETLANGSLWRTALYTAIAAFLTGAAVGLKLPEAPFAVGFAAAALAGGGDWKHVSTRAVAGAVGGIAGVLAFAAYWYSTVYHLTGDPLFPYFNEYFKSPLAQSAPYRDVRFLQHGFWNYVLFPLRFSWNWQIADDLPFRDMRVGLAYVAAIIALPSLIIAHFRERDPLVPPSAARILFVFFGVSLIAWMKVFAIYRYILALELLAPLVIVAAIGLLPVPRRVRLVALGILFFATLVYTRADFLERVPFGDKFIEADLPKFPHPNNTMVIMTGNAPMGYLAPLLPPNVPILRIDGWMLLPEDNTALTHQMRTRVAAQLKQKGDIYLISDAFDMGRAHDALASYRLAIRWLECETVDSNLLGEYRVCPLAPKPPGAP